MSVNYLCMFALDYEVCECLAPSLFFFSSPNCSIEKYTLQVSGEESYLDGKNELISFKDIRR